VIDLFLPVLFYWVRRWRWERLHPALVEAPRIEAQHDAGSVFFPPPSPPGGRWPEGPDEGRPGHWPR